MTFDEKSPADLMQTFNEIFSAIDPQQTPDQDEPEDAATARMLSFLVMLKFPIPARQREDFRVGLTTGYDVVVFLSSSDIIVFYLHSTLSAFWCCEG